MEPSVIPRFFNTLTRGLEPLEPREPGKVGFYSCGPTVYGHAHIGNLRTFLFEDLLRRALRHLGYEVTQVMNLTDVDDKTIKGAMAEGVGLDEHTAPFIESFFRDLDRLHVERAEQYPRATRHVAEMIQLIERLEATGATYAADGSVYFRITADEDYGRLSGFDLDQMRQGERVADDDYDKEDVRDFVLWKGAKPGEPSWESPWGPGRPGWHIECSAMSMKYLGESFDIHSGGVDNIFPHHENEIAQSETATGKPFARLWLHSKHLIVDGEKMSKSLGNFYTLDDLLARGADLRAVRYLFLSVNYRKKLNFTFDSLADAGAALRRVDEMRFRLGHASERKEAGGQSGEQGSRRSRPPSSASRPTSPPPWPTTSTPPAPWRRCSSSSRRSTWRSRRGAWRRATSSACWRRWAGWIGCSGSSTRLLGRLRTAKRGVRSMARTPRSTTWSPSARRRASARTSPRRTGCATS